MAKQLVYQFDLGGQTRTLDFGMYCWELFGEKMQVSPGEIMSVFKDGRTFRAMRMIIFCAISANDFLSGIPTSVTEEDTIRWTNASPDLIGKIFTTAMSTFFDLQKTEEKKGSAEKKSLSRSGRSKK